MTKWTGVKWIVAMFVVWLTFIAFISFNIKQFGVLMGSIFILGEIAVCFAVCIVVIMIVSYIMSFFGDKK